MTTGNVEAIKSRARNIGGGCGWRSDEHQMSFTRWNTIALVLTILSAIFSGAAGASLLASAAKGSTLAYAGGVLGVLAAVLVTVNTQLSPQARADRHEKAAVSFSILAGGFFELASLATDYEDARNQLIQLRTQRDQVDQNSPRPELWAQRRVKDKRRNA